MICLLQQIYNFLSELGIKILLRTRQQKEHLKEKEEGDKAELVQRAKELKGEGRV